MNFKVVKLCISCKNLQSSENNIQPKREIDINVQREIKSEIPETPTERKTEVPIVKKTLIKTTPILKLKGK